MREGLETGQIGALKALVRVSPFPLSLDDFRSVLRRQGLASPLRALDRSGPI